ncbi:DUF397 domain-containing protein [Streptomyces sp. NPDC003077]|uniref:DUF397 domain-containing protein n=1 Tax=Streptomyces sp. NPDC003077 TaxID=3154443 RepID=UPI0033B1A9E5
MSTHNKRPVPEVDLSTAAWRKSSHSSGNGACVEVAFVEGSVAIRDSKDISRPGLLFSADEWHAFLGGATDGTIRRP